MDRSRRLSCTRHKSVTSEEASAQTIAGGKVGTRKQIQYAPRPPSIEIKQSTQNKLQDSILQKQTEVTQPSKHQHPDMHTLLILNNHQIKRPSNIINPTRLGLSRLLLAIPPPQRLHNTLMASLGPQLLPDDRKPLLNKASIATDVLDAIDTNSSGSGHGSDLRQPAGTTTPLPCRIDALAMAAVRHATPTARRVGLALDPEAVAISGHAAALALPEVFELNGVAVGGGDCDAVRGAKGRAGFSAPGLERAAVGRVAHVADVVVCDVAELVC